MTSTVRCVFTVTGDDSAATPAPLVADVSCLTAGRLRKYATASVQHQPKALVFVHVDGKLLSTRDGDLVDVPTACVIKPSSAKRPAKKADGDDNDAAAASTEDPKKADAAEEEEKPAAAAADDDDKEESKPAAEEAAKDEAKEESETEAKPDTEEKAADETPADEKKADEEKPAAEGDEKAADAPKPVAKKQYQPRNPPRDLAVTVSIRPIGTGRLPLSRDLIVSHKAPKATLCGKCGECPIPAAETSGPDAPTLLDCGHVVAACCRAESNPADGEVPNNGVVCPVCGFVTYSNAVFPVVDEPRTAEGNYQGPANTFQRSPHEAVSASTRVSRCAVCKEADAVGRCAVEQLNMCAKCFEEHLPSGPLRNSHTLLRFDSDNATDALAVLCPNPLHRNLPVAYFCVDCGVLGCHMCLKDSTAHEKCNIVTSAEDFAAVAIQLRRERESETAKATTDAAASTRVAWESYNGLRKSYEQQRAEINARAEAFKDGVEKQKQAALAHLQACYTDSVGRWESRITALDTVRARSATVAATLDGHRALPAGMLLHCEAADGLNLFAGETSKAAAAVADAANIANLVVRFRKEMPSLFNVNGSHPTVDADSKEKAPAAVAHASAVRVAQVPVATIAKRWSSDAAKAAKAAAAKAAAKPAAAAATEPTGAKAKKGGGAAKSAAAAVAALEGASNKLFGETPCMVPKAQDAAEGDAPQSPTANAVAISGVASVARGPRDSLLVVDRDAATVLAVSMPKAKSTDCRVTAVLGGASEESFMFKSPTETVTVAANKDHDLKHPVHALHHPKAKSIVVCDTGNDRVVLYNDNMKPVGEGNTPVASPAGLVKGPMAAAVDAASGGILVFERMRIAVLAPDASKVLRTMKYTLAPNKALPATSAYKVVATNVVNGHGFFAMIRSSGDVHFVNSATGLHLGEFLNGRVVDPATAKVLRGNNAAPAAAGKAAAAPIATGKPINALAAHPDANVVALVSAAADPWSVTLTLVGFEDGHADPQPKQQQQPQAQQQAQQQPGGRRNLPVPATQAKANAQQQQVPKPNSQQQQQQQAAPQLKVLKSTVVRLDALPRADNDTSITVVSADFDGAQRVVVGVRETAAVMTVEEGSDATLKEEVGPLRFATVFA